MIPRSYKRRHRKFVKESFNARIAMEREAQKNVEARLKAVELLLKNQRRV